MKNYHILKVSYIPMTANKDSKVKIRSDRFNKTRTIPYDHDENNIADMAIKWLTSKGFDIVGKGELTESYVLISTTFKVWD